MFPCLNPFSHSSPEPVQLPNHTCPRLSCIVYIPSSSLLVSCSSSYLSACTSPCTALCLSNFLLHPPTSSSTLYSVSVYRDWRMFSQTEYQSISLWRDIICILKYKSYPASFSCSTVLSLFSCNTLVTCRQYRWAVLFAAFMFICKWDVLLWLHYGLTQGFGKITIVQQTEATWNIMSIQFAFFWFKSFIVWKFHVVF